MPVPLQQHPHFAACLRAGGRDVVETGDGVMLVRRLAGLHVGLVSRGGPAMLHAPAPKRCLRLFTAERDISQSLREAGYVPLRRPSAVAEWDISAGGDTVRRRMRKTWRHALERAEDCKLKVSITAMPPVGDHWLLMAEAAQARARGYRGLPLWITRAWATLHPRDAVLIEARLRGACVAGMVFLRHGDVATYHISHCTGAGRQWEAHRLMLNKAAVHFAAQGVARIDLGCVDLDGNEGLARFKLGTGAVAHNLGGTWMQVPGLAGARRVFPQWPLGNRV